MHSGGDHADAAIRGSERGACARRHGCDDAAFGLQAADRRQQLFAAVDREVGLETLPRLRAAARDHEVLRGDANRVDERARCP